MYLNIGNTSLKELEEFHYFREGFEFLYFCPRCIRNFETHKAAKSCKTCSGAVRLLQHKEKKQARKYNYLCEKCGKIESEKRIEKCLACKGMIVPVYRWDELNIGDRILIWLSKISSKAEKTPKHEKTIHLKLPKLSFRMPGLSLMPTFTRKSKEEMPTY